MTAPPPASPLLLLHPNDNVLIAARTIAAGAQVDIEGDAVTMQSDIALGHKVARVPLKAGDKIRRYGVPIGTMTAPVARGGHVHSHNLASDYLPSHSRETVHGKEQA